MDFKPCNREINSIYLVFVEKKKEREKSDQVEKDSYNNDKQRQDSLHMVAKYYLQ